jgi:RNA polymerase sigma-70 factor, ECF subfamily
MAAILNDRDADSLLVERVQQGDKRAFGLLVEKYHRRVARLVARLVRNAGDIDDVTQEAFIKAYRALPQFRGDSAFYTWLYRIAINTAKNHLVSQGKRPQLVSDVRDEDSETFVQSFDLSDDVTPDAVLHGRQVMEAIQMAMDALPEDMRTAVTLREIDGLSYEDIAQIMECPIGTIRSRIFRAREAIAQRLRPLLGTTGQKRW